MCRGREQKSLIEQEQLANRAIVDWHLRKQDDTVVEQMDKLRFCETLVVTHALVVETPQ